ncbi:MAG: tetratricopeptide repeat protein [Bacteroidales bacterium]|nr:tetratricopeptide repeat protein [Bacteroidales bacterium]
MRYLFIFIVVMSANALNGQEVSTDSLRKRGYEAMTEGKIKEAIRQYSAILAVDSADYDARLALGKLHYRNNTCDSSVYYYQTIYNNDTTDAEAMMGFSRCFIRQGKLDTAIYFGRKTVKQLPEHIPAYLLLAKALSYDGRMDEAIDVYLRANKHDSTWSEVWAGLGRCITGKPCRRRRKNITKKLCCWTRKTGRLLMNMKR